MKILKLTAALLLAIVSQAFAQEQVPDTLIIGTKHGKIILVSDSLQKFNFLNSDELIKKALLQVQDSLSAAERKSLARKHRDTIYYKKINNTFPFRLLPVTGLGLIRDKASPFLGLSLDFAPQRQDYYFKNGSMYTFINLATVPYFTFEKTNTGNYRTFYNVFLEASMGNRINNERGYGSVSELSAGVGYLVRNDGSYFLRNTFKIFFNIGLRNSFLKVRPELFVTDNFKQAFPGIAIKIY